MLEPPCTEACLTSSSQNATQGSWGPAGLEPPASLASDPLKLSAPKRAVLPRYRSQTQIVIMDNARAPIKEFFHDKVRFQLGAGLLKRSHGGASMGEHNCQRAPGRQVDLAGALVDLTPLPAWSLTYFNSDLGSPKV